MDLRGVRFIVYARHFDRSVEFYGEVLGLSLVASWDRDDGVGAVFSLGKATVVELRGPPGGAPDEAQRASGVSLGLEVDDVDAWFARLRSKGIDCPEPEDQDWGGRLFFVFDPNDLPVAIYKRVDSA